MAEYDNLLARAELVIRHAREDADGWEAASKELTGRQHFSFAGVARMLRDVAQVAEDLRALQTENTELREEFDGDVTMWANIAKEAQAKITEVKALAEAIMFDSDAFAARDAILSVLSSYPLGEGQTPKLDPKPWLNPLGARYAKWAELPFAVMRRWSPRPEYSQNRADYEGQTQQGDER